MLTLFFSLANTCVAEQLDVSRKILSDLVKEIHSLTDAVKQKHDYTKLQLQMSVRRGYHFTYPKKAISARDLPNEFIQVQNTGMLYRYSFQINGSERNNVLDNNV